MSEEKIKKQKVKAKVISQKQIAQDVFDMWIETDLALTSKPGQFIGIYTKDKSMLLPRPISICLTDREKSALRLVYRIAGAGTREFSSYKVGDDVEILGNLGNGFPMEQAEKKEIFLMGGGIGIPPILGLAARLGEDKKDVKIHIILGYRDSSMFLKEEFEKYGQVYIATEDGSFGAKGNVMDAIRENGLRGDLIYACGPMPMLRAIKKYAEENQMDAYLSLEERMACGVGACLGCVAKTKNTDAHSHVKNARICTDGPVFEAKEVDI